MQGTALGTGHKESKVRLFALEELPAKLEDMRCHGETGGSKGLGTTAGDRGRQRVWGMQGHSRGARREHQPGARKEDQRVEGGAPVG